MKNIIYLFVIAVISVIFGIVSCADKEGINSNSYSQTGLIDQSGNIVRDTLTYTNTLRFTGNIPIWATNVKDYTIKTNVDLNYVEINYNDAILTPNLPDDPSDIYKIFVPYSSRDYYTVNYKDTNKLKQLWFEQINRKGPSDGKVFAIRNKSNDRDANNFQKEIDGRYDYYYFRDNGDIVWKGGDKTDSSKEIVIKRFVGAVIVDYRKVRYRTSQLEKKGKDTFYYTGEYTVGAIYKMAVGVNEARDMFANGGNLEGAYEFIAARKWLWFKYTRFIEDKALFVRQFYDTNFMEVMVLNHYGNEGNVNCLGVDAYYAYYGNDRVGEGATPPIDGFNEKNMPYMTNENLYLGKRPEDIIPLLSYTTTFTDATRNFKYLAMPGHKY